MKKTKPIISILIPTYNYSCVELVRDLHKEIEVKGLNIEIIVADDASTDKNCITENLQIGQIENCSFYRLTQNIGRAAIRNKLADLSQADSLLFIDSDAKVISDNFVEKFVTLPSNTKIACGGIQTKTNKISPDFLLRQKYELAASKIRSLEFRQKNPYKYLSTFNLFINKETFNSIRFSTNGLKYGYEDTLLGIELKNRKINIFHFDNSLLHLGIDSNKEFIEKTEMALRSLILLGSTIQNESNIAMTYNKLKKWRLASFIKFIFSKFKTIMKKNLLSSSPSLFIFKLYKLGFYASLKD